MCFLYYVKILRLFGTTAFDDFSLPCSLIWHRFHICLVNLAGRSPNSMNAGNYLSINSGAVIWNDLYVCEPTGSTQLSLAVLSGRDSMYFSTSIDTPSQFLSNLRFLWFFFVGCGSSISVCKEDLKILADVSHRCVMMSVPAFLCAPLGNLRPPAAQKGVLIFRLTLHLFYPTPWNKITFWNLNASRTTENNAPFHKQWFTKTK